MLKKNLPGEQTEVSNSGETLYMKKLLQPRRKQKSQKRAIYNQRQLGTNHPILLAFIVRAEAGYFAKSGGAMQSTNTLLATECIVTLVVSCGTNETPQVFLATKLSLTYVLHTTARLRVMNLSQY